MQTTPLGPPGKRVLIRRKTNAIGAAVVGCLWWGALYGGIWFALQPGLTYQPQAIALFVLSLPILLIFDLMHTAVLVDPAKGVVTTWRGHLIPWGRRNVPIADLTYIDLSTVRETHRVAQRNLSGSSHSYTPHAVDVTTISLACKTGENIVVESSSLVTILQEQLLALTRALPLGVVGRRPPEVPLTQVWTNRLSRRGAPGILLILIGLAVGGFFAIVEVKNINFEKTLPCWSLAVLLTIAGSWLAITGAILPRSLRRTANAGEQSPSRFILVALSLVLCVSSLVANAGTAIATHLYRVAARDAVKRPGLDKLSKSKVSEIMGAWGFHYQGPCEADFFDGCAGTWERDNARTTVYLVDLSARAAQEPSRVFLMAPDRMVEVTVKGAAKSAAYAILAELGGARDRAGVEAALKRAGYDRMKSETDGPSARELKTTAEHQKETIKAVVLVRDLSEYPKGTHQVAGSRFLHVRGSFCEEVLLLLSGN